MFLNDILLIEDCEVLQKLVAASLKDLYAVSIANNAEEALEILETKLPKAILLDIMLPGLSGLELCSFLKGHERYSNIPIIIVSAKTGPNSRAIAYEMGCSNYLEKPYQVNELKAILKSTFNSIARTQDMPLSFHDVTLEKNKRSIICSNQQFALTPKEYDIMLILMNNFDRVVTREQLIQKINHEESNNSERFLDNYIGSIRKKLSQSKLEVKTHYSTGYELRVKKAS